MDVLLLSPLYVEALPSLPIPADLLGNRKNSTGLDLSVHTMRQPLLVAWQAVNVLEIPFLDTKLAYSLINTGASSYQKWSNVTVAERSVVLRRAADELQAQLPKFCALLPEGALQLAHGPGDTVGAALVAAP